MRFQVFFLTITFWTLSQFNNAQQTPVNGQWNFNLFTELYVSRNHISKTDQLPVVFYNHKQLNNLHLNLLSTSLHYKSKRVKSTISLMIGGYSTFNLAHEPTWARPIHEATISFLLSKKSDLWLQLGVMPSHIGNETATNWNNWTQSRNLSSENSPYYQTGASLNYHSKNKKWTLKALMLTGWQTIFPLKNTKLPSFGTQLQYDFSKTSSLSWNQFFGQNQGKYEQSWRYYSNLFFKYSLQSKLDLFLGFDIGHDKKSIDNYGIWTNVTGIIRYNFNAKWKINLRGEYFNDAKLILLPEPTESTVRAVKLTAYTLGLEWFFNQHAKLRFETKLYFDHFRSYEQQQYSIISTLGFQFNLDQRLSNK